MSKKTGTKEWAEHSLNIAYGCSNGCRYCYARQNMVNRFKKIAPEDWPNMVVKENIAEMRFGKRYGVTMFPTAHDITPAILEESVEVLKALAMPGNQILIVTKPNFECIKRLCEELKDYKDNILFRFTIGSANDYSLSFWEPNAPCYDERARSLAYAFSQGYGTSISCEPYLDLRIGDVVEELYDFVTDTIWIGKMNHVNSRIVWDGVDDSEKERRAKWLRDIYSDKQVLNLYEIMCHLPKIRWKDSIAEVIQRTTGEVVE